MDVAGWVCNAHVPVYIYSDSDEYTVAMTNPIILSCNSSVLCISKHVAWSSNYNMLQGNWRLVWILNPSEVPCNNIYVPDLWDGRIAVTKADNFSQNKITISNCMLTWTCYRLSYIHNNIPASTYIYMSCILFDRQYPVYYFPYDNLF